MQIKLIHLAPFFLITISTIFSCSDMNSVQEMYSTKEQIYAGKLDSLRVVTGYKRVKIIGLTRYLGKSNECTVAWDNKSKKFPIENIVNGKFEMIVDGLEERSYEFKVTTNDTFNNQSVIQIVKGRAIGDIFKNSQKARRVDITYTINGLFLNWADQTESFFVVYTTVKYDNTSGGTSTVIVKGTDIKTELVNWKRTGRLEIISTIGSPDAFDTIDLDPLVTSLPQQGIFPIDRSNVQLAKMASDNPGTFGAFFNMGNPVLYLFDGDESYKGDIYGFHSGPNSIPHHFTIDLDKKLSGIKYEVRKCRLGLKALKNSSNIATNQNNPTQIQIWGRPDLVGAETTSETDVEYSTKGWVKLYDGSVDGGTKQIVEFDIATSNLKVRYLRYKVLKTYGDGITSSTTAQLTEMTFWGF